MAFDLGDPIPLTFLTKDATGNPANVTTAVLTITLPDGTSVTPAVGVPSPAGTYAPATPYLSTLAGIHRVSWVGTGTNAQSYTDVFNVMAADPRFLISLADARRGIRMSGTATDEDLRDLIADVTPIMEYLVGPLLPVPRVETHDGGRGRITLLYSPLISVTSVIESYGSTYERTLPAQNLFDGSTITAYGYTIDLTTGLLTRRISGRESFFPDGRRNVQVSYTSGRAVIGGNILRATRYLIRHLWQLEQGIVPLVNGQPVPTTVILGYAVPNMVIEMVSGDARVPGVA
jgi:hypothetical protein